MPFFDFTVTLRGQGKTPEEAWLNAVEHLSEEPGEMPEEYSEDDDADSSEEEDES